MQKTFYFPVPLDAALDILRHKRRLHQPNGEGSNKVLAYTDRALAVLAAREVQPSGEICLVAVEIDAHTFGLMMMGDMQHFGPCAHWRSDNILELDHFGQELALHEGRFSLQIVSFQDAHWR